MKKAATLLSGLILSVTGIFGQEMKRSWPDILQNPQVNTRIDNIGYWTDLANRGLIPFNPDIATQPALPVQSKDGMRTVDQMATDVAVLDEAGVTQSENSVFVNPNNNSQVLNSNNSESGGGIYGANYLNSADAGQTWTGSKQGAGGTNKGDPAACIGLNGRRYIGFISSARGQGIAYSDNGTTWTPVTVAPGVTSPDLLDKNHLCADNTSSAYAGNVYAAWTNFVTGNANDNDIEFSRSTNSGVSWSGAINISNAVAAGAHNQGVNIQTGPAGQVYCTWAIYDVWSPTFFENAIGFAKSTNGGASFGAATRIHNNIHGIRPSPNTPTTNNTGKNMRVNSFPSMAVDVSGGAYNGRIYIVWSNLGVPGTNTGTNVSVYCMRSTDGGNTWLTPVRVNQGTSANDYASFFPWITCDPVTGKLYCVFYDDRNLGSTSTALETWMATSEDGGATWTDIKVSDVSFTPAPIAGLAGGYFGDYLGISARNGWVYPTWTDNRSGRALTYVSPIHFSDYCYAAGGCDEYISNVSIGSINNSSLCEGYQNFTNLTTNVPVNSSVPITVTNGTPSYSADQCGIWVDWNRDGDFDDAGETVSVGGTPGVGPYTATIDPPDGETQGPCTMRIRITWSGAVTPCGNAQYGEVEDYTINVSSPAPNYWVGGFNHYWHQAANWSLGHIPTAVEDVYITNAGYQPVWIKLFDDACDDLNIQAGGTLQVEEKILTVNGSVNIQGSLTMINAAGILNVGRTWNNFVGAGGFTPGPGRVVFNGGGHQYCSDETFNILEVNKPSGGAFRMLGTDVVCAAYDWTAGAVDVLSGSFTANDLLDNGISGAFYNNSGGTINLTNSAPNTWVDLNGELHIYGGVVNVYGNVSDWPFSHNAVIEMNAGILDFHDCGININNNGLTLADNITGGTIRTAYGFSGNRADFTPSAGTVELYGPSDAGLSQSNGSTLYNVNINKSSAKQPGFPSGPVVTYDRDGGVRDAAPLSNSISLVSNFTVTNNLTISNGSFILNGWQANINNYCHVYGSLVMTNAADKLYVGTNAYDNLEFHAGSSSTLTAGAIYPASWVYSSGAATINSGVNHVINFLGSNIGGFDVEAPGSVFGSVNINRTSGDLFFYNSSGNQVELAGDLNIAAGNSISLYDISTVKLVVHGLVTDNATSTIHELGSLIIDTDFTLDGTLDIGPGSVVVHGVYSSAATSSMLITSGSFIADSPVHAKGWEFLNGHLSLTSGLFEISHNSVNFGSTATNAISGGTIRSGEAFGAANAGTFQPTGGKVEIVSVGSNTIYCSNGNYFHNLLINRDPGAFSAFFTDVVVNNNLTVQAGTLSLYGNSANVSGGIALNGGTLTVPANSNLRLAGGTALNVNNGGRINVLASSLGSPGKVTRISTGNYSLNVNSGGTIAAQYGIFEYMNANGVNLLAGSQVDPDYSFKGCAFQQGASGGTLLTANNSQVFTVRNAVFPANTWSGASNVTKTVNAGDVYFVDFIGDFSGETFDNDVNNRIDWVPVLTATATASPLTICAGSTTQLNISQSGGVAPFTYLWSPSTGLSNSAIANPVAGPPTTTTYYVTVTDNLGTATTSSVLVTVIPSVPASVTVTASANPSPPGSFVLFTAAPVNGGATPSYQWKVNGSNAGTGLPTFSYVPSYNDHVSCVMTSNAVCPVPNPATSNTVTMIIVPVNYTVTGNVPSPLNLCFDASNTLTVAGGGSTFHVSSGARAVLIAGVNIRFLNGTDVDPGGYMHGYITTTNAYCGSLTPSMVDALGAGELATAPVSLSKHFTIYPNPTTGVFTLQRTGDDMNGMVKVEIFDLHGSRIASTSYTGERSHQFSLTGMTQGIYFVKVISGEEIESFKLILTR